MTDGRTDGQRDNATCKLANLLTAMLLITPTVTVIMRRAKTVVATKATLTCVFRWHWKETPT